MSKKPWSEEIEQLIGERAAELDALAELAKVAKAAKVPVKAPEFTLDPPAPAFAEKTVGVPPEAPPTEGTDDSPPSEFPAAATGLEHIADFLTKKRGKDQK